MMRPRLTAREREVLDRVRRLSVHYLDRHVPERALSGVATVGSLVAKGYLERLPRESSEDDDHYYRVSAETN